MIQLISTFKNNFYNIKVFRNLLIPNILCQIGLLIFCLIRYKLNFFAFSGLLLGISSFVLAHIVLAYSTKKVHIVWGWFNLTLTVWGISIFLLAVENSYDLSMIYWRIFVLGLVYIGVFFYHVVSAFCERKKDQLFAIVYLQGFIFTFLIIFTNIVVSSLRLEFNQFWYLSESIGFSLFLLVWVSVVLVSFYRLFKFKETIHGIEKTQANYLFYGMLLGFLGGGTTGPLTFDIKIYPFGTLFICVYAAITTYAIFKYRLMDIRVAITNTAIFLAVYALVLGVPFGLAVIGKEFFIRLAGENWFFLPMLALLVLATIGPYILKKLQSKAEQEILKDQEVYQRVLEAFSSELDRYETTDEIVQHAGTILYKSMQLKNLAFYLRNNGGLILQKTNTDELSYKAEITDIEKINWDLNRNKAVLLKELEGYSQNGHNFNEFLQLTEAALVVPLIHHRKLKGFLFLGEKKNGSLYSRSDFISLSGLAHSLAMQLEYAEILKARTKRIEQEMHDQRLKDLGLFSAKVAHQMNNRLGRITGNLDGFRFYFTDDVLRNAPREKLVEKINRLLKSIPVILKDAMSASQISKAITTSAKTGTEPAVYKLKGLVDGGRALAETKHPHFRYEFIDEYDPEIKVWANDTIIQDVFSTGIDNSLYAMRKKQAGPEYAPQLTVKASVKDGIVTIELTDNGSGIKEEDKQYLFVPLFTSKGTDEGTGFGLANMKTMIEGQGGTIRIDSEQNKWTTLTITLPEPTVEQSKKKEGV